jgi:hypothetical protein
MDGVEQGWTTWLTCCANTQARTAVPLVQWREGLPRLAGVDLGLFASMGFVLYLLRLERGCLLQFNLHP